MRAGVNSESREGLLVEEQCTKGHKVGKGHVGQGTYFCVTSVVASF